MTAYKQKKPDVITYGDHEVITPDHTRLRQTVRQATPEEESEDPVARADEALYAAKGSGRNRVCEMAADGRVRCLSPLDEVRA